MDVVSGSGQSARVRRFLGPADHPGILDAGYLGMDARGVVAGPGAHVMLYCSTNRGLPEIWLFPGQRVETLRALPGGSALDSAWVVNRPPQPGQRGYERYAAQRAAGALA